MNQRWSQRQCMVGLKKELTDLSGQTKNQWAEA